MFFLGEEVLAYKRALKDQREKFEAESRKFLKLCNIIIPVSST